MNISGPAFAALDRVLHPKLRSMAIEHVSQRRVNIYTTNITPLGVKIFAIVYDPPLDEYDPRYDYGDDGNPSEEAKVGLLLHTDGHLSHNCSIDDDFMCDHAGAVFLLSYDKWAQPPAKPSWQAVLESALPNPAPAPPSTEVCLFVEVQHERSHYGGPSGGISYPTLAFRPGVRGKRGNWIKGAARWGRIDDLDAAPAHLDALISFERAVSSHKSNYYYWGSSAEWVTLTDVPGDELRHILAELRQSGIPLVSHTGKQLATEFSLRQLTPHVQVSDNGDGLLLRGEIRFVDQEPHPLENATAETGSDAANEPTGDATNEAADESANEVQAIGFADASDLRAVPETLAFEGTFPIGEPPTFIVEPHDPQSDLARFTIYELTKPLPMIVGALITNHEPLLIPAAELETFEHDFLPRIQSVVSVDSPDGTYEVPAPPQITLSLHLVHGESRTHTVWEWNRPGSIADTAQEAEILQALQDSCAEHTAMLWPKAATGSTPQKIPADATYGRAATAQFNAEVLPLIRGTGGVIVTEEGSAAEYRAALEAPLVSVESEAEGDWFNLQFTVTVDGEEVEFSHLFTALAMGDELFVLPSGTYFPLIGTEFSKLREILEEARALTDHPASTGDGEVRVSRFQVDLWEELTELGIVAAQEAEWWLAVQSLGEHSSVPQVDSPAGLRATLRDYQAHGMSWLHFLRTHGLGGILADDMGLGKTIQTIAMMELAREAQPDMPPFLVVAPTSVVGNWAREVERFAPELRVTTVSAMESRRKEPLAETIAGAHVVVTSYALFRGETEAYRELSWSGLILDEAQQIKNHVSHGYKAARALGAPFTLVITGTPIENNLLELWALTSLAAPGLLGSRQRFTDFFRTPVEKDRNVDRLTLLQRRLRPFLLRRTKDLVAKELPAKQEQVLEIELHPKHRKLYDVRFQRERQRILGLLDDPKANRFQVFQSLTMLRQLALDPALTGDGDAPSAKLDALVELLSDAAAEGHRVLVLSQFTRFLSAARDRAAAAKLPSQYLDGASTNRQRVIDEFREGTDPVFFVSLKAGGFGLNLVEADYVVLLDPWWNPAVEAQAIDRTHRIGQTKPVFVYRLVAANTIEQKVIALRESKAELFARVLDGSGEMDGSMLSAAEITSLLE